MGGLYIWYSVEGTGRVRSPPSPLYAVQNVTADPSTANVAITVLLYNDPLLYGLNVPVKALNDCRAVMLICLELVPIFKLQLSRCRY